MRYIIAFLPCLLLALLATAEPTKTKSKTPSHSSEKCELVASRLEGNAGYNIFGKFNSREKLLETLSLSREIGTHAKRKFLLYDILVSMDLNVNGDVASWKVSGPKVLLDAYVAALKKGYKGHDLNKSVFYVLDIKSIKFKSPAEIEAEEGEH